MEEGIGISICGSGIKSPERIHVISSALRAKNIIIPKETNKRPVNFKIGKVYRMIGGYHTYEPYYVFIEDAGKDFIQTSIPNKHSLMIKYPSLEWNYHIHRMTCVGQTDNYKIKELLNQPSLPTHNK